MKRIITHAMTLPLALAAVWQAQAQSSLSSPNPPAFTMQSPLDQVGASVIKDGLGRPCLDIEAAARAQAVNPKMLDHVVSILNKCPRTIRVRVCYVGSFECKQFSLQGYQRQDTILGSMAGATYFKFKVFQQ